MNETAATNTTSAPATEPAHSAFTLARMAATFNDKQAAHDRKRLPPASRRTARRHTAAMATLQADITKLTEAILDAPLRSGMDTAALAVTAFTRVDVALSAVLDTEPLRAELRRARTAFARVACFLADDLELNLDGLIPGDEALVRGYADGA